MTGTARLILTAHGEARARAGHPWIYQADVRRLEGSWRPDDAVTAVDRQGRPLGRGFYNPRPQIVCRLITREDEPVDARLFRSRLQQAWAYRCGLGFDGNAGRVVASEADGLPGLVLDRYDEVLVLSATTLGIERHADTLAQLAAEVTGARAVYRRVDAAAQAIEGLAGEAGWLLGEAALDVDIREGPCRFRVGIGAGQKTGFYLDQRENRELVAARAAGRDVLDAFCYTGAFSAWTLAHGARHVLAIDSSEDALARARTHLLAHAGPSGENRFDARLANAFDALRDLERAGRRFDLVILDPPPFTRRRATVEAALRGYKEIILRGLRCLRPGGLLAAFSCSHHVGPALFEDVCRQAAADVGRPLRFLAALGQARDHPVLLLVPETRYLTGLLLEALA